MSDQQSTKVMSEPDLETQDPGKGLWIVLGLIVLIIGAFIFLRTEPSQVGDADELATMLVNGQPKLIEFYSNF